MQVQTGLFPKVNLLFKLIFERLSIIFKTKNNWKKEVDFSSSLLKDFIVNNFSIGEKIFCLVIILFLYFSFAIVYDFFTYGSIDTALRNQQSAKAESLIQQRLAFNPTDNNLKLRLARAYFSLGRGVEAKKLIEEVQSVDSRNPYLGKVARELAIYLRLSKKEYQAIPILEKIPLNSCKDCLTELLYLYTVEGRNSLLHKNLSRANYFLSRALKLAEKVKESNSSVNHRKRELAKAYNMQAFQLIQSKQIDNAINILEISKDIFPIGQTYEMLGKLYLDKKEISIEDLKKSLDCSDKAYSFGLVESEVDFREALKLLRQKLRQKGLSNKEVNEEVQGFQLSSVKIAEESEKEIIAENKIKLIEIAEIKAKPKKQEIIQKVDKEPANEEAEKKQTEIKAPNAENIKTPIVPKEQASSTEPAEAQPEQTAPKRPQMYESSPYEEQKATKTPNQPEYKPSPFPDN